MRLIKLTFLIFVLTGCANFDGPKEASYRPDLGNGHMYQFKLHGKQK